MRTKKIPTIIGVIILVLSVAAGVLMVQFRQVFRLGASGDTTPKNVRVSNITDSSFSVSWTTDANTSGFVNYGENQNSISQIVEDQNSTTSFTHSVNLTNLKPQAQYFFKINSGGNSYDNSGTAWQIKTGPILPSPSGSNLISGSILTASGSPSKNALVYVSIGGYLLSTITSQNGSWVIQLAQARAVDLSSFLQIDSAATLLEISVDAGPDGIASAQIYPVSAKPAPPITLGQTLDFKNLSSAGQGEIPQASIDIANQPASSPVSGFNLPKGQSASPSAKTVTLESLKEGETITSQKPEFFGNGPSNTAITIQVESDPINSSLKIPANGSWNWSPPSNLAAGVHKITITWKDAQGITRSLTRNFVVQAAEGPAFVSTPSASPRQTQTPTSSPTSTPKVSPTTSATSSATPTSAPKIPESGNLTPSILFSILGIGVLGLSFLVWKKAET